MTVEGELKRLLPVSQELNVKKCSETMLKSRGGLESDQQAIWKIKFSCCNCRSSSLSQSKIFFFSFFFFFIQQFCLLDGILFWTGLKKSVLQLSANMQEQLTIKAVSACISTISPASASLWHLLSVLFISYHAF